MLISGLKTYVYKKILFCIVLSLIFLVGKESAFAQCTTIETCNNIGECEAIGGVWCDIDYTCKNTATECGGGNNCVPTNLSMCSSPTECSQAGGFWCAPPENSSFGECILNQNDCTGDSTCTNIETCHDIGGCEAIGGIWCDIDYTCKNTAAECDGDNNCVPTNLSMCNSPTECSIAGGFWCAPPENSSLGECILNQNNCTDDSTCTNIETCHDIGGCEAIGGIWCDIDYTCKNTAAECDGDNNCVPTNLSMCNSPTECSIAGGFWCAPPENSSLGECILNQNNCTDDSTCTNIETCHDIGGCEAIGGIWCDIDYTCKKTAGECDGDNNCVPTNLSMCNSPTECSIAGGFWCAPPENSSLGECILNQNNCTDDSTCTNIETCHDIGGCEAIGGIWCDIDYTCKNTAAECGGDNNCVPTNLSMCNSPTECSIAGGFWCAPPENSSLGECILNQNNCTDDSTCTNIETCHDIGGCEAIDGIWCDIDYTCKKTAAECSEPCDASSPETCGPAYDCFQTGGFWCDLEFTCKSRPEECSTTCTTIPTCFDPNSCAKKGGFWCNNSCKTKLIECLSSCAYNTIDTCSTPEDCIAVGGFWCNDGCQQTNCLNECTMTNPYACINPQTCIEIGGSWCNDVCQPSPCTDQCSKELTFACTTSSECSEAGGFWCGNFCQPLPCRNQCSKELMFACTAEEECKTVGGFWCGTSCQPFECLSECTHGSTYACTSPQDCTSSGGFWCDDACREYPCEGCNSQNIFRCVNEQDCRSVNGFWCDWKCQPQNCYTVCNYDNPELCLTEPACMAAGGLWCETTSDNGSCQLENCGQACSEIFPYLCNSKDQCQKVGGFWCDGVCQTTNCNKMCDYDSYHLCFSKKSCTEAGGYWCGWNCQNFECGQGCSPQRPELCFTIQECTNNNGFWCEDHLGGNRCKKIDCNQVCNSENYEFCLTEDSCTNNDGVWCGSTCRQDQCLQPLQPSNYSPSDNETSVPLWISLTSSPFTDQDNGNHRSSNWKICRDKECLQVMLYSGAVKHLTEFPVAPGHLLCSSTYYWQVKHQDEDSLWSNWSKLTKFETMPCKDAIDQTGNNMDLLPDQALDPSALATEVYNLITKAGGVGDAMLRNNIAINADMVSELRDVSSRSLAVLWDNLIANAGIAPGTAIDSNVIAGNNHLMDEILKHSAMNFSEGLAVNVKSSDVLTDSGTILTEFGLDALLTPEAFADYVALSQPKVNDPDQQVIKRQFIDIDGVTRETGISPMDLLRTSFSATDFELEVDEKATGQIKFSLPGSTAGETVKGSVYVQDTYLLPTNMPDGIHSLPSGTLLNVENGIGIQIAPAAHDPVSVTASILAMLASETGSITGNEVNIQPDGQIFLTNPNGDITTGAFSYIVEDSNSLAAGTTSFSISGTDPTSDAYQILVQYSDGSTQGIPPSLTMLDSITVLLDDLYSGKWTLDRETGIFTVETLGKWKPDYTLFSLTNEEQAWQVANQMSPYGLAFKQEDFNGDGLIDMWIFGETGKQLLYAVQ